MVVCCKERNWLHMNTTIGCGMWVPGWWVGRTEWPVPVLCLSVGGVSAIATVATTANTFATTATTSAPINSTALPQPGRRNEQRATTSHQPPSCFRTRSPSIFRPPPSFFLQLSSRHPTPVQPPSTTKEWRCSSSLLFITLPLHPVRSSLISWSRHGR